MNENNKKYLLPRLRFSEFEDAGSWCNQTIEDFFKVGSSKRVLQKDWTTHGVPFYRTRELVSLSKGEPFSSEIFISDEHFSCLSEDYGVPKEGDFLVSGVGTLGISYQVQKGDKFYFKDGNVLWLSKKSGINSTFFKYCFESDWIQNQIIGQTSKSTVGTYTIQNAKKTSFWCPPKPEEQQKIADCLSSLDELIAAHTQKHQELQSYKKGLLQNLFPAEGETVPTLRFPEFDEVWLSESLGNIGLFTGGGTPSKSEPSFWEGNIPWISSSDIFDESITNISITRFITQRAVDESATKLVPENSILLVSRVGVGKLAVSEKSVCTSQDFTNFTPQKNNIYFLAYYLKANSELLLNFSQGMAIKGFTKEDISKLDLWLPKIEEQQKIANCLSSVDELITAQAQKIEKLKAHKKGLMQQLFPPVDEVGI